MSDQTITPEPQTNQGGFAALRDPFFARYITTYAISMTGMMVRVTAMG